MAQKKAGGKSAAPKGKQMPMNAMNNPLPKSSKTPKKGSSGQGKKKKGY